LPSGCSLWLASINASPSTRRRSIPITARGIPAETGRGELEPGRRIGLSKNPISRVLDYTVRVIHRTRREPVIPQVRPQNFNRRGELEHRLRA
jgi:hypothetical protein